ncbi:MAG: hybrid sensor histidine kinase/response regulator, partial [Pseudomonadota bacterium]
LKRMDRCVERIKNIVNGLRTYARMDTEHSENINFHKIIDDCISLIGAIYSKEGVTFELKHGAKEAYIRGNIGRTQQVLMNLFSNARDSMKGRPGKIIIETANSDGNLILRVIDSGMGIKPENVKRIFDPFFTTKDVGKGTGLGLGIVLSIIQSMKGKIELESEVGIGTCFNVTFPNVNENENIKKIEPLTGFVPKGTVLVVDDEEDLRDILSNNLKKIGVEVTTAKDGKEALELCHKFQFDYIISDIKMPQMDGLTFLRLARPIQKAKFLVITGGVVTDYTKEERDELRTLVNGYVKKPFSKDEIFQALAQSKSDKT